ncbi:MAG: hypothetical protein KDK66_00055 [Deltaproteobacteria bacterium]|nr:hypothetical protein [Deltaproteobacteria bacterium]
MAKVLILQNHPDFDAGSFAEELKSREIDFDYHKVFESGAPQPELLSGVKGLIILGGPLSFRVDQVEKNPKLLEQISFLRVALEAHQPMIAVSQGACLLAAAQGAWVEKAPKAVTGWTQGEIYSDYSRNSVIYSKVEEKRIPAFSYLDTFHGFPPKGYWYVYHPDCRYFSSGIHGNCYLFNFHPEVTEALLKTWVQKFPQDFGGEEAAQALLSGIDKKLDYSKDFSRKIIHAFASFLR